MSRFGAPARRLMPPADRWAAWRELVEMAERLARRAVATDGREIVEHVEFRQRLALSRGVRFPVDGDSATDAAAGFVSLAQGMLKALADERRAALGPALLAAAACLEQLMSTQVARAAALRCGERDD